MQKLTTRRLSWHSRHQNKKQDQDAITRVMQWWFRQGDSTILEMYAPNKGASKDMKKKKKELKREIGKFTITGDFTLLLQEL